MQSKWSKLVLAFGLLCGIIYSTSCTRDPNSILGDNLHNENDLMEGYKDTIFEITAYSVFDSGLIIQNASRMLLGSVYDNVFGSVQYNAYVQLVYSPLSSANFDYVPGSSTIDSVVLTIPYSGLYPTAKKDDYGRPITVSIHELTEELLNTDAEDSLYSIDAKVAYDPSVFSGNKFTFTPKSMDTIYDSVNSVYIVPPLRVNLSKEFGAKLLNLPEDAFTDIYSFQKQYKGICIMTEAVNTPSASSVSSFTFSSGDVAAQITVYFDNDPTESAPKIYRTFTLSGVRYTGVERNATISTDQAFRKQLLENDTSAGKDNLYVEASGGPKVRFALPNFKEVFGGQRVIVNKADLIIPVSLDNNSSSIARPKALYITGIMDNSYKPDGVYSSSDNSYHLNITRELQNVLYHDKDLKYYDITPTIETRYGTPCRVKLGGTNGRDGGKIKLKVIYTQVQE